MKDLTEREISILIWVRDGRINDEELATIPNMAKYSRVSIKTIQDDVDHLVDLGLVRKLYNEAGNLLINGRELTSEGKRELRDRQIPVS